MPRKERRRRTRAVSSCKCRSSRQTRAPSLLRCTSPETTFSQIVPISLLFINYYFLHCLGLPCFNSNVAAAEVENVFTQCRKFMMIQSSTKVIFYLLMFIVWRIKYNVGGLFEDLSNKFSVVYILLA